MLPVNKDENRISESKTIRRLIRIVYTFDSEDEIM